MRQLVAWAITGFFVIPRHSAASGHQVLLFVALMGLTFAGCGGSGRHSPRFPSATLVIYGPSGEVEGCLQLHNRRQVRSVGSKIEIAVSTERVTFHDKDMDCELTWDVERSTADADEFSIDLSTGNGPVVKKRIVFDGSPTTVFEKDGYRWVVTSEEPPLKIE